MVGGVEVLIHADNVLAQVVHVPCSSDHMKVGLNTLVVCYGLDKKA